jgi:hypothetical protein
VVSIDTGTATLNIQMHIAMERQEVTVSDASTPLLSTDPTETASAQVMHDSATWRRYRTIRMN